MVYYKYRYHLCWDRTDFISCTNILIDSYIELEDYNYILNIIDNSVSDKNDGCEKCIINDLISIERHIIILIFIHFFSIYNYIYLNKYIIIINKEIKRYKKTKDVKNYILKNQNLIICEYKEINILDFLLNYGTINNTYFNEIYKNMIKKIKQIKIFNNIKFFVTFLKNGKEKNNMYLYNINKNNKIIRLRNKVLIKKIYERLIIMSNRSYVKT